MSGRQGTIENIMSVDTASEPERVVNWRMMVALNNGADTDTAERVGRETEIDLHEWVGMVRRGCAPATAYRILRPIG